MASMDQGTIEQNQDGIPAPDAALSSDSCPLSDCRVASRVAELQVAIPAWRLTSPQSCYEPFDSPASIMKERQALEKLARFSCTQQSYPTDYIEYDLDDFVVYCDTETYPCDMRPLHHIDTTKRKISGCLFDGVLSVGGQNQVYVKRIPIKAMPVGNYGVSEHSIEREIWFQSELGEARETYYRLGRPAKEFRRFYEPSIWLLNLAKHCVDYCDAMHSRDQSVSLDHFRSQFSDWIHSVHENAPAFLDWAGQHPSTDFRTSVVAHADFLHKEFMGVLKAEGTYFHSLWSEILTFERYKRQPTAGTKTVVTQYIYDCFGHMAFGDQFKVVPVSAATERLWHETIKMRRLELPSALHDSGKTASRVSTACTMHIKPGDTISIQRDCKTSGTMWQRQTSKWCADDDRWFALVRKVHVKKNQRMFDVIWYYQPIDTPCALMRYPCKNELFLSDHCSCAESHKIQQDEVLGVHQVDFGGNSTTKAEFFCRQMYIHPEHKWITLSAEHMRCEHERSQDQECQYQLGDTVLVHIDAASSIAEPCVLSALGPYQFRRLLRRRQVRPDTAACPNEVVYSDLFVEREYDAIIGRCHVRFFRPGTRIPTPYDRNGVGAYFYMSYTSALGTDGVRRCVPLDACPGDLRQGFDPAVPQRPKLRGLDLFCGGGNFGRGLEEGGGIQMCWANDNNSKALHTYMANVTSAMTPFLGSIDDMQRQAFKGNFSDMVPRIGEVDFISGGSPCPGFSHLTNDKTTPEQHKNQSLVAAFASFVDLYRPKYALLENVRGIVQKGEGRHQDVFSQLICAVVGLGYQAHFFLLDASSYGAPQLRTRVFIVIAAPGYRLPEKPVMTHSYPPGTQRTSLGDLSTGQPIIERLVPLATPFKYVSASEATADLPEIGDAKPDICPAFADHRTSMGLTHMMQKRISYIPKQPWGMNLAKAWYGRGMERVAGTGGLTKAEFAIFESRNGKRKRPTLGTSKQSNAWGRMHPHRTFDTIVTNCGPSDGKNGRTLHWYEDRIISIMEARRAQGIRDDEVLLGLPAAQYRTVGNSVAREAAIALGSVFREAWVRSSDEVDDGQAGTSLATQDEVMSDDTLASTCQNDFSSHECSTPATGVTCTAGDNPNSMLGHGVKRRNGILTVEIVSPKRERLSIDASTQSMRSSGT